MNTPLHVLMLPATQNSCLRYQIWNLWCEINVSLARLQAFVPPSGGKRQVLYRFTARWLPAKYALCHQSCLLNPYLFNSISLPLQDTCFRRKMDCSNKHLQIALQTLFYTREANCHLSITLFCGRRQDCFLYILYLSLFASKKIAHRYICSLSYTSCDRCIAERSTVQTSFH